MTDQTLNNTLVMNKKRSRTIFRCFVTIIIVIMITAVVVVTAAAAVTLPSPYLHNTFCIENLSPLLKPICLHCCLPEQAASKPAQPKDRGAERSIAKPLEYLRGVGIVLWRKPRTNTVLPEGCANQANTKVLVYASSNAWEFKDPHRA